jgi:hypothetical protein
MHPHPPLMSCYACRDFSRNARRDSSRKNRKARNQTMQRAILCRPAVFAHLPQPLSSCQCRDSSRKNRKARNQAMKRVVLFRPAVFAHLPQPPPETPIVPQGQWIPFGRSSIMPLLSLMKVTKKLKTASNPVAATTQTPSHKDSSSSRQCIASLKRPDHI